MLGGGRREKMSGENERADREGESSRGKTEHTVRSNPHCLASGSVSV